ncbi:MAG: hypothetical protein ACK5NY_10905 [Burkholderiaceae bacterium]
MSTSVASPPPFSPVLSNVLDQIPDSADLKDILRNDTNLRQKLELLLGKLMQGVGKFLENSLKSSQKAELARIDKLFEQIKKQLEAKHAGFWKGLFTKIAMAVAIVAVMVIPVGGPVLTGIVVGIMAAQLAGEIYADATGKESFFNDAVKAICGGNADVAKWVTLGIDLVLVMLTMGAAAFAKGGASLLERILALFNKQLVAAETNVVKSVNVTANSVSIGAVAVGAGFTIEESVLKIQIAAMEKILALLDLLINGNEKERKKAMDELGRLSESRDDIGSGQTSFLSAIGKLNI